jgi:hypothetical protein
MGSRAEVANLALSLPDGCTDNASECPECGHTDFSITREGGVLRYICFRVSCGFKGNIGSRTPDTGLTPPPKKFKPFTGRLECLHLDEEQWLMDEFLLDYEWLSQVRWGLDDGRVYFPQYNIHGGVQLYIARHYPALTELPLRGGKAFVKPVLAQDTGLCLPHTAVLPMIHDQRQVVLVEDYPSCLRVLSQLGLACCCLGGTNLYDSMVDTLMELGVDSVILILDADAVTKAVMIKQALNLVIPTQVIPLTGVDLKDMTEDELTEIFKDV